MNKELEELHFEYRNALNHITTEENSQKISKTLQIFRECKKNNGSIYFIGNGGSSAICSHMAQDYTKCGKIRARNFNDAALITCLANDYSFGEVFSNAVQMYCNKEDVLVAISSSGKSADILYGIERAKNKNMKVITLSGFDEKNYIINEGDANFFVNSKTYRTVELLHEYILHTILDLHVKLGEKDV